MKAIIQLSLFIAFVALGIGVSAQCVTPNFTYNVGPGGVVTFTDNTYNTDTTTNHSVYTWNFGDGTTSNSSAQYVTHTFTGGTLVVSLEIANASTGCDLTSRDTVAMNFCQSIMQFTDTMVGNGEYAFVADSNSSLTGFISYIWNFGDGTVLPTQGQASVSHLYAASGNYPVSLTISCTLLPGCVDSMTRNLNVSTCSFPLTIDTAILSHNPAVIQFSSSAQSSAYTYAWSFSDGGSGTGATVSHNYPTTGNYNVNLSVSDATTGCAATAGFSLQINNSCAFAAPDFTYNINLGGQVTFTDFTSDSMGNGLTYIWNFGDGDTAHNNSYQVTHSYGTDGTYAVSLEILNASQGCDLVTTHTFQLNRCHPAAQFTDASLGSGNYDFVPFNQTVLPFFSYAWNFGDGGTSTSDSVVHQYLNAGDYSVSLIATCSLLSCADTSTVNLHVYTCGIPSVSIDTSILSQNPVDIQFQSSAQNAGYTYTWSFSDGGTSAGAAVTHNYPNSGTYSVNLSVTDASTGCAGNSILTFQVSNSCGSLNPNFSYNIGLGGIVTFIDNGIYGDSIHNAGLTYIWNFGDGDTAHNNSIQVNHTYAANGTYTATLEVLNASQGCDSVASLTFTINRCHPGAAFANASIGFGSYDFIPSRLSIIPLFTYAWNFGDGSTSTADSIVHQYSANGNYTVTLVATSSLLGCADTSVQNLAVNLCSFPVSIDTTILSYGPVDIRFLSSVQNSGYTYAWSFSNGGTASGEIATHSFLSSGNYTANLTVTDVSNGCSSNASLNFQIGNICGVNVGFTNAGNGLQQSFYVYNDSLQLGVTIASYAWLFNGATPGTGTQVFNISYPVPGTYSACLYATTTTGCIDTVCQSIVVTRAAYSIAGQATIDGNAPFIGTVYLIVQDSIGHLALLDSTISTVDSSGWFFWSFNNLQPDTYYVKAALSPSCSEYAAYLPTYWVNALNWDSAAPVVISNRSIDSVSIWLTPGTNLGGPGFVAGYVSQGAGLVVGGVGNNNAKSAGQPLQGVQINLLTGTGDAVAYTYTDANGHYQFHDLALGSYKIYAEELNKKHVPIDFTLTAENPTDTGANISINSRTATGISNLNNLVITEVYPNPVINNVELLLTCNQGYGATLKLIDVLGRTALSQQIKLFSGPNAIDLNMESIAAGVYTLAIQTGGQQVTYKIVKAK